VKEVVEHREGVYHSEERFALDGRKKMEVWVCARVVMSGWAQRGSDVIDVVSREKRKWSPQRGHRAANTGVPLRQTRMSHYKVKRVYLAPALPPTCLSKVPNTPMVP